MRPAERTDSSPTIAYIEVADGAELQPLPGAWVRGLHRGIAYRSQNGGDYDTELVLCPELAAGETGLGVHRSD